MTDDGNMPTLSRKVSEAIQSAEPVMFEPGQVTIRNHPVNALYRTSAVSTASKRVNAVKEKADKEGASALITSMQQNGYLKHHPFMFTRHPKKPDTIIIVHGHKRATTALKTLKIPAWGIDLTEAAPSDSEVMAIAMSENLTGRVNMQIKDQIISVTDAFRYDGEKWADARKRGAIHNTVIRPGWVAKHTPFALSTIKQNIRLRRVELGLAMPKPSRAKSAADKRREAAEAATAAERKRVEEETAVVLAKAHDSAQAIAAMDDPVAMAAIASELAAMLAGWRQADTPAGRAATDEQSANAISLAVRVGVGDFHAQARQALHNIAAALDEADALIDSAAD